LESVRDFRVDQAVPLVERAVTSADRAVATVDRLAPAMQSALAVAQDAPKLVATEHDAAIKALHDELDHQRVAAMQQVIQERGIALKQLHDALADQAQQLARDADQISTRKIDDVMTRVTWLVVFTIAGVLTVALVGLLLVKRMLAARPHSHRWATRHKMPVPSLNRSGHDFES
jgi:hypothetical protein